MNSVKPSKAGVNCHAQPRGRGQPSKQTVERIRHINRAVVQAVLAGKELPSDVALGTELHVSERTVRTIRLEVLGMNRRELQAWQRPSLAEVAPAPSTTHTLICTTPFAGLWLLIPQLLQSGCVRAAEQLEILGRTRVRGIQIVLTLVAWAALGFQRL